MKIHIEFSEAELRQMVLERLTSMLGDLPLCKEKIQIEVKSKMNYKSEWEQAAFRAVYDV